MPEQTNKTITRREAYDLLAELRLKTRALVESLTTAKTVLNLEPVNQQQRLNAVDNAIDRWNELINLAPRNLKRVKLEYLLAPKVAAEPAGPDDERHDKDGNYYA